MSSGMHRITVVSPKRARPQADAASVAISALQNSLGPKGAPEDMARETVRLFFKYVDEKAIQMSPVQRALVVRLLAQAQAEAAQHMLDIARAISGEEPRKSSDAAPCDYCDKPAVAPGVRTVHRDCLLGLIERAEKLGAA